jgi:hypothetical protein
METNTQAIVAAALKLPESDRADIVMQLLETLTEGSEGISIDDPDFMEEMERRFADPAGAIPWSELRSEE